MLYAGYVYKFVCPTVVIQSTKLLKNFLDNYAAVLLGLIFCDSL